MEDFTEVATSIGLLRALGASIALDGFGSGCSSLSRLLLLNVDKIKVDKSFVSELGRSTTAASIIRSIVGLCADLGVGCGVEGVETEKQRAILQDLGCRWMQGYLFGKPVSLTDLPTLLAEDDCATGTGARPRISVALS